MASRAARMTESRWPGSAASREGAAPPPPAAVSGVARGREGVDMERRGEQVEDGESAGRRTLGGLARRRAAGGAEGDMGQDLAAGGCGFCGGCVAAAAAAGRGGCAAQGLGERTAAECDGSEKGG